MGLFRIANDPSGSFLSGLISPMPPRPTHTQFHKPCLEGTRAGGTGTPAERTLQGKAQPLFGPESASQLGLLVSLPHGAFRVVNGLCFNSDFGTVTRQGKVKWWRSKRQGPFLVLWTKPNRLESPLCKLIIQLALK